MTAAAPLPAGSAPADTTLPQFAGGMAFVNEGRPCQCPLEGVALDRWMEGYVFFAVRDFSRRGAASPLFHAKQPARDGVRWTRPETRFLAHAWPSELPVAVVAALLARPERACRQAAHTLGLKRGG